jgi:DNA processing protein
MSEASIYSIRPSDARWPELLKELPKKAEPAELHVRGELPPADALSIGIVGTRRPTRYGKDATEEIARTLAEHRIPIVSGLAIGVDTISHKAALEARVPTIAVLGCGLDENVLYPKENLELMRKISRGGGAVISEYENSQKPELWTFPQRNRIIAGIAKAIVVIEAGEKSGALITARFALEFGREVFALPGSIYNSLSQGTNKLIKQGATPITSAADILEALGIESAAAAPSTDDATPDELKILSALEEERALDEIIKMTRLPAATVLSSTSALEIRGMIKGLGGGMYRKV